jgi:hypothetical protein
MPKCAVTECNRESCDQAWIDIPGDAGLHMAVWLCRECRDELVQNVSREWPYLRLGGVVWTVDTPIPVAAPQPRSERGWMR